MEDKLASIKNQRQLKFDEMGLHPDLLDGLNDMGFTEATPVQAQAIPLALDNYDVLAIAQTGTGKTGAFLIPVLDRLCDDYQDAIDTLIITPTRELAMQIEGQIMGLNYYTGSSCVAVYGGRDGKALETERKAMKQGVDIIVATPGRLKTHLQMGHLDLSKVRTLILDEADRMLDMGFISDIELITKKLPKERQTLLFSATFPPKIQKLAKELLDTKMQKEIRIAISKPPSSIKQQVYFIHDKDKDPLIAFLLKERKDLKRAIVFANRKTSVRQLYRFLERKKLNVAAVESGMQQSDREEVLRKFKNGTINIVVATDVLSRGIDIKEIELVINYDVPSSGEDYVHRIGRTARAQTTGQAITLVNGKDKSNFLKIEQLIEMKAERPDLPEWLKKSRPNTKRNQKSPTKRKNGNFNNKRKPKSSTEVKKTGEDTPQTGEKSTKPKRKNFFRPRRKKPTKQMVKDQKPKD